MPLTFSMYIRVEYNLITGIECTKRFCFGITFFFEILELNLCEYINNFFTSSGP